MIVETIKMMTVLANSELVILKKLLDGYIHAV